jgi:hypothetical protein
MTGVLSKILFHNGKLPWLQIIIGIIIGAVSSLLYVRYRKPTALIDFLNISPPIQRQALKKPICDDGVCSLGDQKGAEKPRRDQAKAEGVPDEDLPPVFPLPIYITEEVVKNRPRKRTTELAPIEEVEEDYEEGDDCQDDEDA